jgi:hypothetical protein
MTEMLKKWLLRFIKPECLPRRVWMIDVYDKSMWFGPFQICMGSDARKTFNDFSPEDQSSVLHRVHLFFEKGTVKLLKCLPFNNDLLVSCKFLSPQNQKNKLYENWVKTAASELPSVIASEDISMLEVECRLQQNSQISSTQDTQTSSKSADIDVAAYWKSVSATSNVPTLVKLARAMLILPHGNANVERVFSMLTDIVTKKRSNLGQDTVKALIVTKSCLETMNWSSSSLPITDGLLQKASDARASYESRLKEKERSLAEEKQRQRENDLLAAFAKEKKSNKTLADLQKNAKLKEDEIKKIQEQKETMMKVQQEALKAIKEKEANLQSLLKEKDDMENKKKTETEKIYKTMLKRKTFDIESSSFKIPKK